MLDVILLVEISKPEKNTSLALKINYVDEKKFVIAIRLHLLSSFYYILL